MKKLCVLLALAFAPAAGAAYKCVDAKGVTYVGDTPPDACATVVMYEIRANGSIVRKIDPTPTPEQLKSLRDEQEKQKEADRVAAEQKRKDMALLASFGAEREFDVARDRNIEPLAGRIRNNEDRMKAVDKRIKEIEEEMEFYRAGKSTKDAKSREPPPVLIEVLARARTEKASLEKANVGYKKEIEDLKAKFEVDKKRWVALKSGGGTASAEPPPPAAAAPAAAAPAKAAPRKTPN